MRVRAILMSILLASAGADAALAKTAPTRVSMELAFIMQVDGWIVIDPQGKVADFQRDTTVPDDLSGPIDRTVRSWLFEPVVIDGAPVRAKAKMRITLAAQNSGDVYRVVVENVIFPKDQGETDDGKTTGASPIRPKSMAPPSYPSDALRAGISGLVLLAVQAGPDGKTVNAAVIQTALLHPHGRPHDLAIAARQFELAALAAVKKWTYRVDETHPAFTAEQSTATVTINFTAGATPMTDKPGKWRPEMRTARTEIPWLTSTEGNQHVGVSDSSPGEAIAAFSSIRLESNVIGISLQ
jgi:hypothetical protein